MKRRGRGRIRWLVTIAAAGSLGLLVFSCVCTTMLYTGNIGSRSTLMLHLAWGEFQLEHRFEQPSRPAFAACEFALSRPAWRGGLLYTHGTQFLLHFPLLWLAVPMTLAMTAMWFVHIRRRRRMVAGGCVRCGYDLSGSGGAVCPECGGEAGKK